VSPAAGCGLDVDTRTLSSHTHSAQATPGSQPNRDSQSTRHSHHHGVGDFIRPPRDARPWTWCFGLCWHHASTCTWDHVVKRHFVTRKNSKVNLRCVRRYRRPVPRCRGVELEVQVADEGPDARRSHQSLSLHSPSPAAEGKGTTIAEGAVVPRRQNSYGRGCISKHLTRTSGPLSHDRPIDRTSGPSRSARCGCSVDFTTWTSQAPTS